MALPSGMLSKAAIAKINPAPQRETTISALSTFPIPAAVIIYLYLTLIKRLLPEHAVQSSPPPTNGCLTSGASAGNDKIPVHLARLTLVPCILSFFRLKESGGGVMFVDWCIRGTGKC